jgi:WAS/WASL-interacting protein
MNRQPGRLILATLAAPALLAAPAAAQSADDWRSAPLAIPSGAAPSGTSEPPLQAPAEVRRPQTPLQPGQPLPEAPAPWSGDPAIRVAPGAGVRPQPRPPLRPQPQPQLQLQFQPQATPAPPRAAPPVPPVTPPRPPAPKVRSFLETLPPGTIQPLPGETLPGSTPPPAPARPPQVEPQAPQVVPPPPWAKGQSASQRPEMPWLWLLLGLGIGGGAVFLLQDRRRPAPGAETASTLGIRVLARPDPGVQTLRPAPPHGEQTRGTTGE